MSVADRVRELIEPLVAAAGLDLVEIEQGPGLLRIYLDDEGGIDLDTLTRMSEQISDLLDVHDPIPGRYTLEVSSPGLERNLRTPAHYLRYVGTTINVKTRPGVEGERRFSGTLSEADDEGIVVAGRRLSYGDIEKARTVFEWGPAPKPGQPRKATKTS